MEYIDSKINELDDISLMLEVSLIPGQEEFNSIPEETEISLYNNQEILLEITKYSTEYARDYKIFDILQIIYGEDRMKKAATYLQHINDKQVDAQSLFNDKFSLNFSYAKNAEFSLNDTSNLKDIRIVIKKEYLEASDTEQANAIADMFNFEKQRYINNIHGLLNQMRKPYKGSKVKTNMIKNISHWFGLDMQILTPINYRTKREKILLLKEMCNRIRDKILNKEINIRSKQLADQLSRVLADYLLEQNISEVRWLSQLGVKLRDGQPLYSFTESHDIALPVTDNKDELEEEA